MLAELRDCLRAGDMCGESPTLPRGRAAAHPVPIDERLVADHWTDLLRLAALIRTGMTNAFALLERLSSYPRANIFEQARQPT